MPDDHPANRRTRGAAERDKVALDNIAAILNQPLSCTRAEMADRDRDCIALIASFVQATGR